MIRISSLRKSFGKIDVLQGVDLMIPVGRVTGIVGPNAAGKTTLIKSILGLTRIGRGTIEVAGAKVNGDEKYRPRIGYMPQIARFPSNLTGAELLQMLRDLRPDVDHIDEELIRTFGLGLELSKKLNELSGGTRQKINAVAAFMFNPELYFLDEPTAGLDPEERLRFHNLISESASENTVVILSTHIVSDVANLCSHMAIIRKGKIISADSPRQAVNQLKGSIWEGTVSHEQLAAFKSHFNVISSRTFDGQARVRAISKGQRPSEEFTETTPVLEDHYFDLVNRQDQ